MRGAEGCRPGVSVPLLDARSWRVGGKLVPVAIPMDRWREGREGQGVGRGTGPVMVELREFLVMGTLCTAPYPNGCWVMTPETTRGRRSSNRRRFAMSAS